MNNPNNDSIRHCPGCGATPVQWRDGKELVCASCGFSLFLNVAAAVGLVLQVGDRILLTRRLKDPGKGLLDLPGGFIDPEETAEEGLRRELAEELDLTVGELSYLCSAPNEYPYKGVFYRTLDVFYLARAGEPPPMEIREDIAETVWLRPDQVNPAEVAFSSVLNAILFMQRLFS